MLRRIAHAPEGESTKLVSEISASERLTQLLDYDKKGFISKEDIYNTCFAVGLDLSVSDMKAITDVKPKRHAEVFMGVLMDYKLPIGEVEELVDYFTRTRLQRRPDKFKHLPRSEYFIKRFIELYTPIAALFIDKFIPNVTPDEQSVYNITRNVFGGFDQFVLALIYTSLILTVTGISNISPLTVIAVLSVNLPVGWGSHSARESYYWSSEGTVLKNAWQRRLMILRYTTVHLKSGSTIDGLASVSKMCEACNILHYLPIMFQPSPLGFVNQRKNATSGRRRSSIGEDYQNRVQNLEMKTRAGLDEKYSLLTFEWHKLMPFFTAIVLSALPTIVKATKGESNILDATHSDADIAVDVMMSVFILFTMFFVSLAILKDASEELANSWRLVELLLRSIQPEDEPRKKVRGGEEESLAFRLDSSAAVEGFIALYKFIAGYVSFHNEFHIASFAMLSVICVASVIVSFIGSVLMFEIDVWNSYLMALAILIWPVVLTGLFHIVKIDELLNLRLKKYLRHQRRMNEKILRLGENHHSAEEGAKLKNVCEQIDQFIEEIDDTHKTIKLLGKLPLNKVNMIRLAGAMGAGIFTTIMRSAINLD